MENSSNSVFSKLMSIVFIAMGIFLGIYAFFANATTWTIGSITRDNSNYLTGSFRDQNPTTGDIITALYGTGDEGTAYTQHWNGYNSGSCLSAGMQVEFTGIIPATLTDHTIYVIASGTYDITSPIVMNDCSALITSGIVLLSGNVGSDTTINVSDKQHFIIEKIQIANSTVGGIQINTGMNFCLNEIKIRNSNGGLGLEYSNYGTLRNIEISQNTTYGVYLFDSHTIVLDTINTNNNNNGINFNGSSGNTLSGITSYGNTDFGLGFTMGSDNNFITSGMIYDNDGAGISIQFSSHTIFDAIDSHNNDGHNIYLYNSHNNNLNTIIANTSTANMGLYLGSSSFNVLSGVTADGNYYAGVHLYNSNNNTGTNIIANSNEGGLYMENSTGNTFNNFTASNSTKNGVALFGSNNNILNGLVSSGNMNGGIYMSTSDDNVLYNAKSSNNNRVGLLIEGGDNNTIENSTIRNNINNGIQFSYGNGNTINVSTISLNNNHGIGLDHSQGNHILNSAIDANGYNGINTYLSNNTIISGCALSGNMSVGIDLSNSNNNIIQNSHYYFGGSETWKYSIFISDSIGTNIAQFSGNKDIYAFHQNGIFNDTLHDSYTKLNNYTRLYSYNSATLTGNTLSIGNTFVPYFDELKTIGSFQNYLTFSGATSFTISGATWDGKLYTPTTITAGTKKANLGETGISLFSQLYDTIEVVSGNTYLTMNGGTGAIDFYVSDGISGQYLSILKSTDGNTWSLNTLQNGCILNDLKTCHFNFNGDIKLFAFGTPGLYFTGTTQTGTMIISGGYYNTGVRIMYTGLNISGATLNGFPYTNNTLITGNNTYTFTLTDTNENSTGVTFTIDRIAPMFTGETIISGTPIISGGYYNEADIYIDFSDLYLSGAILSGIDNSYFSGNFDGIYTSTTGGVYIFTVRDLAGNSTGMTFTIDRVNPLVTGNYPTSGLHISGINNIPFSRTGWDNIAIDTYTLSITGTQIYTGTTTANTSTVYLPNGSYTRHFIAKDRAGNTGSSQTFPFIITAPYTGSITLTGPNAKYIGTQRFTKDWAGIYMRANDPTQYTISGAIDTSPLTGTFSSRAIHNVLLTGVNGAKDIFVTMDNGSGGIISKTFLVQLDTVAPIPTLTSPINGTNIAGTITLNRSAGPDAAGLSGYRYFISPTDTFGTIFHSGSTTTSSVTIPNGTISYTGTLYRKVIFIDRLGNTGSSTAQFFNYTGGAADTIPSSFHFNDVTNADLDEIYASNTITITGMTPNTSVLASINRGALYISGHMVGTTGYIQNGRTVKIELNSSYKYDTSVESTLTIGGVSDTFKVTTKKGTSASTEDYEDIETDLSNTQKLMVIAIFETLKDLYGGDKEEEFFNTMLLMLDEKMDEYDDTDDEYIALKYLYDLIEQYYDDGEFGGDTIDLAKRITNGLYTAPNGKKYRITYDSSTKRFTSTNFVVPKYFPTLDTLKYIIDINNPAGSQYSNAKPILARWKNANIDGTRQTSPYTAPNKKVFYFFKDITGKYSSYTFTSERYFNSLNEVKEFIYNSNKK